MSDSIVRTPWKDYMGEVPMHLEYFDGSMFEAVERIAKKYPGNIAFTFIGKSTTYRQMIREIEQCAKALKTIGAGLSVDFISIDLRSAWEKLGELTGETVGEDIINEIFSKFCMGK